MSGSRLVTVVCTAKSSRFVVTIPLASECTYHDLGRCEYITVSHGLIVCFAELRRTGEILVLGGLCQLLSTWRKR